MSDQAPICQTTPLPSSQSGFSLLEVIITLTILISIVFAVSQLMRASFDVRSALSQEATVTNRINLALEKLSTDITHVYHVSTLMVSRTNGARTIFKIDRGEKGDKLMMTYLGHSTYKANAKESDISYVVYEVRPSNTYPGRSHLYRGEFPRVPEDFKEDPPMKIFVEHIKSLKVEAWRGDDWSKDRWDTGSSDTRNLLPQMVRVTIETWLEDPEPGETLENEEDSVVEYATIVYLPMALDFKEMKERTSSFNLKATQ